MVKRNYSIDLLKFFCILGVIIIHTMPFKIIPDMYWVYIALNTIARVCVPLFFISTGYFYCTRSNWLYTKKYIYILFLDLLRWNIIYLVFGYFLKLKIDKVSFKHVLIDFKSLFYSINISDIYYATGPIKYHLWYIPSIIIVIFILYFILQRNLLESSIKIFFVFNLVGVLLPVLINTDCWIKVRDALFLGLFYSSIGCVINKYEQKFKSVIMQFNKATCYIIVILLFMISIVERCVYMKMFNGCGDYYFTTIPLSILVFSISLVNIEILKNTTFNKIGRHTLGIYLIHPMIMSIIVLVINYLEITWVEQTYVWQLIYPLIVLSISYISMKIIKTIRLYFKMRIISNIS